MPAHGSRGIEMRSSAFRTVSAFRTPDVVEFAVSPQVGQAVLAFARSDSSSGPNSVRAGRRAPPAPPAKLSPSKGMAQPSFPARPKLRATSGVLTFSKATMGPSELLLNGYRPFSRNGGSREKSGSRLVGDQYASPRLSMPRTRIKSGGSRQKKTRHLPTRSRSSSGRSLRDFTSPWPVAAKRTRAASIRAWTTRSRRARSRTPAGRKTTRRITAQAGVGLLPGGHRHQVPNVPDPAWPRSRHRRFPAHPIPQERKWPPAPQCPEERPRGIEGGCGRRTCFNYSFAGERLLPDSYLMQD